MSGWVAACRIGSDRRSVGSARPVSLGWLGTSRIVQCGLVAAAGLGEARRVTAERPGEMRFGQSPWQGLDRTGQSHWGGTDGAIAVQSGLSHWQGLGWMGKLRTGPVAAERFGRARVGQCSLFGVGGPALI